MKVSLPHALGALAVAAAVWVVLALRGKADLYEGGIVAVAVGAAALLRVLRDSTTTRCPSCGARVTTPLPPPPEGPGGAP